jgi:hypothetical protein
MCSDSSEAVGLVVYHCVLCALANYVLCSSSYDAEFVARERVVMLEKAKALSKERQAIEKEAYELRDEVYVMTLERYDLAELENKVDQRVRTPPSVLSVVPRLTRRRPSSRSPLCRQSPVEKAMAKLQAIQGNRKIPKEVFLEIKAIIQLLGSSSDIFKPQIEEELANKNVGLDADTEKWIVDLVNGDIGGAGRRKTLTDDSISRESGNGGGAAAAGAAGILALGSSSPNGLNNGVLLGKDGQPLLLSAASAAGALAAPEKSTSKSIPGSVQSTEEKQFAAVHGGGLNPPSILRPVC